jgi:hypothetical protein
MAEVQVPAHKRLRIEVLWNICEYTIVNYSHSSLTDKDDRPVVNVVLNLVRQLREPFHGERLGWED